MHTHTYTKSIPGEKSEKSCLKSAGVNSSQSKSESSHRNLNCTLYPGVVNLQKNVMLG